MQVYIEHGKIINYQFHKVHPLNLKYIENANIMLMFIFKFIQIVIHTGKVGPYKECDFPQRYTNKSGKPII